MSCAPAPHVRYHVHAHQAVGIPVTLVPEGTSPARSARLTPHGHECVAFGPRKMRHLSREQRVEILELLNDGMSIRAVERRTRVHRDTITKLVVGMGQACAAEHGRLVHHLTCRYVEADEIWAFCGIKAKRVPVERQGEFGVGDVYTFTSIDSETKLVPTWLVGQRDMATATQFLTDLGRRSPGRFQLSTDAAHFYSEAAEKAFAGRVDYAQIWKHSVTREEAQAIPKKERTPLIIDGHPDPAHINTSFIERHNLNMRMSMRRFTRKTNGFSKKAYNLSCAIATYMFHYNFCRPHMTLTRTAHGKPTTPAMAAGLARHRWTMAELVGLLEAREESAIDVARRRKDRRDRNDH